MDPELTPAEPAFNVQSVEIELFNTICCFFVRYNL